MAENQSLLPIVNKLFDEDMDKGARMLESLTGSPCKAVQFIKNCVITSCNPLILLSHSFGIIDVTY